MACFVEGATPAQAAELFGPLHATGEHTDLEMAELDPGEVFVRRVGDWTELWGGALVLPDDARPSTRVLETIFGSTAGVWGFTLHDGPNTRRWTYSDGQVIEDEGPPLPIESTYRMPTWGIDEDFIFAVIRNVTGVRFDPGASMEIYREGEAPPRHGRGWFRRKT